MRHEDGYGMEHGMKHKGHDVSYKQGVSVMIWNLHFERGGHTVDAAHLKVEKGF